MMYVLRGIRILLLEHRLSPLLSDITTDNLSQSSCGDELSGSDLTKSTGHEHVVGKGSGSGIHTDSESRLSGVLESGQSGDMGHDIIMHEGDNLRANADSETGDHPCWHILAEKRHVHTWTHVGANSGQAIDIMLAAEMLSMESYTSQ